MTEDEEILAIEQMLNSIPVTSGSYQISTNGTTTQQVLYNGNSSITNEWQNWLEVNGQQQRNVTPNYTINGSGQITYDNTYQVWTGTKGMDAYKQAMKEYVAGVDLITVQEEYNFFKSLKLTK